MQTFLLSVKYWHLLNTVSLFVYEFLYNQIHVLSPIAIKSTLLLLEELLNDTMGQEPQNTADQKIVLSSLAVQDVRYEVQWQIGTYAATYLKGVAGAKA